MPTQTAAEKRTGIIYPAYVDDDIQVFENILISRPNDVSALEPICLLQQEAPQRFIAVKCSVVSADLYHFSLGRGVAWGAEGHDTGMQAAVSAES